MKATANRALEKADKKIVKFQQREEKLLETVADLKDKLQNVKADLDDSYKAGFEDGFAKAKDQLLAIMQKSFGDVTEVATKKRGPKAGAKATKATKAKKDKVKAAPKTKVSKKTAVKGKRGRPAKSAVAKKTQVAGLVEVKQVKRRGRPRKTEMTIDTQAEAA